MLATDSAVTMLKYRHVSSYTIDTAAWEDPNASLQKNSNVWSRNLAILLTSFVFAMAAILGTFTYVSYLGRDISSDLSSNDIVTSPLYVFASRGDDAALPTKMARPRPRASVTLKTNVRRVSARDIKNRGDKATSRERKSSSSVAITGKDDVEDKVARRLKRRTRGTIWPRNKDSLVELKVRPNAPMETNNEDDEDEGTSLHSLALPRHLTPLQYSVLIHPHQDDTHYVFSGVTKIIVLCLHKTRKVSLHAVGIQVLEFSYILVVVTFPFF